jgi:A/G-specific adenine glycosylase
VAKALIETRRRLLLDWASSAGRDLPWRRTRDPWAVLVSETMLQQTQVARVIPKFEAFMARYPDVGTCAAASVGDVIALWSGLGYNRRAVNLHRAANVFVDQHDGVIPADLHLLRAVPGIGDYTARAVLAFAFELDAGVLDTNAARVLARWEGRCLRRTEAQTLADRHVPPGQAWSWNQAMLDLGATICTAGPPDCTSCPVAPACGWHITGQPEPDPAVGTAGSSARQSRFEGSDRQGRGRLVATLRIDRAIEWHSLAEAAGWEGDHERAHRAAESLVRDGLASWDGDVLTLPA